MKTQKVIRVQVDEKGWLSAPLLRLVQRTVRGEVRSNGASALGLAHKAGDRPASLSSLFSSLTTCFKKICLLNLFNPGVGWVVPFHWKK